MNQYKFLRWVILLVVPACFISCKKEWLDEKSSLDLVVPVTLKDFQAILNSEFELNKSSPSIGVTASGEFTIPDDLLRTQLEPQKNAYTWTNALLNSADYTLWNKLYKRILYCNVVLEGLKKIDPKTESDRLLYDYVKGQALFHRAYSFNTVAQLWSPPYSSDIAAKPLGIPLRLESDINIPTQRSTIQQTYDQIMQDIKQSELLLPNTISYITRPSKPAVYALLARVYISMEDYINAYKYVQKALGLKSDLINFNNLNSADARPIGNADFNPEMIFYVDLNSTPATNTRASIVSELYNSYDEKDLRKQMFYRQNANGALNFRGSYTGSSTLFEGLTTNELYLIKAECAARNGNAAEAMYELNNLIVTRWDKNVIYPLITAGNPEEALRKTLIERRKELVLRASRWSDLRRLNKDSRFAITMTRVVDGVTYSIEPNSYKYTFPIPDDIIQQTGILQNPDWRR